MRSEFSNITERSSFLKPLGDGAKEESLTAEKTGIFNSSRSSIISSVARSLYPTQSVAAAAKKFSGAVSLNASPTLNESMKISIPSPRSLEEGQTTASSRSQVTSPSSSIISEVSSPKSPREIRYEKMLTAAHAREIHAEYAALCESWKGASSKLNNKYWHDAASNLLKHLAQELSVELGPALEKDLAEENKALSDFAKLNKTAHQPIFNEKLKKEYWQVHGVFQKALHQYLICKEIVELRLLHASPKEVDLFIDVLAETKSVLDEAIISLEKIKQTIREDNNQIID